MCGGIVLKFPKKASIHFSLDLTRVNSYLRVKHYSCVFQKQKQEHKLCSQIGCMQRGNQIRGRV